MKSSRSRPVCGRGPGLLLHLSAAIALVASAAIAKEDPVAEGTAAATAAGVACSVSDARYVRAEARRGGGRRGGRGGGMGGGEADASGRAAFIEVACQDGLGYLIQNLHRGSGAKVEPAEAARTSSTAWRPRRAMIAASS